MQVDPQTQIDLAQWLPREAVHVAESGIRTSADIAQMRGVGYDAFLIGESLMRQPNPAAALAELLTSDNAAKR
jgi:indole-3-glycerol phosphate synthase